MVDRGSVETETDQPPGPNRPTGREEVRRAVMRAARKLVSARGPRVPLRDIAESSGVNLGLIHRHFGRKDDLLAEVLDSGLRHGAERVDTAGDAGSAVREMLLGSLTQPDYSRLLVWLALDPDAVPRPEIAPANRPARAVQRMLDRPRVGDEHLALAMTVIYAWPVLRTEILDLLEIPADRHGLIDQRVADLLAGLVTSRETGETKPTEPATRGDHS